MKLPRWLTPRFSLRTLFVFVTIIGLWLGWQIKIVYERQSARDQLKLHGAYFVPGNIAQDQHELLINTERHRHLVLARQGNPAAIPSWSQRLLGAQEILIIWLPQSQTERENDLLSCFPEAAVFYSDFTD